MKILVTGAAGFIGFHTINKLLSKKGITVFGLDNINSYYSRALKKSRLENINSKSKQYSGNWFFYELSLEDYESLSKIFLNLNFIFLK